MELLKVRSLKRHFDVKDRYGSGHKILKAVDGIDFSVASDSVFALVGESGCGKSTVAKLALRLISPTEGDIFFEDRNIYGLKGDALLQFRRSVQIVFQDPFASLNPRRTVYDTLSEPLKIHRLVDKGSMKETVAELLNKVGLGSEIMNRYPHEFSGGQRQRICIARALAVSPKMIVADEPLSALDVSIQAQILNLLKEIKNRSKISFLFISHDLNVVHYFSDYIAVMYLGKIVEQARTEDLFKEPLHPYTAILLASAPKIRTEADKPRAIDRGLRTEIGDVPSPINIPAGCSFHPRCPKRFDPCDKIIPDLKEPEGAEHKERLVSCHLWNRMR